MKYLLHVVLPMLIQAAVTVGVMLATNGGGSFVGLGAMLLGVWGIPVTALINLLLTREQPRAGRTVLVSLPVPLLTLAMLVAAITLRL